MNNRIELITMQLETLEWNKTASIIQKNPGIAHLTFCILLQIPFQGWKSVFYCMFLSYNTPLMQACVRFNMKESRGPVRTA